ncbi:aminoglycoside phosphotransferase family protein [Streptomyces sp. NPDC050732]|uniref:aminoglycoside phosphotransferase family protein n=1 Tax=Streptomyces sp. NPDC050732 TaxID=3154632 RepID=UPI0034169EF3
MTIAILTALTAKARAAAHPRPGGPCVCGAGDGGGVLADRVDATVVRHGELVAKAHAPETEPGELAVRLGVAARLPGVLLAPLRTAADRLHGRLVTFWPHGTPVDRDDPDAAPWEAAATLLARLHATPATALPRPLPPMRGPAKAARAVERLRATGPHPAAPPVLRAWAGLPAWARAEAPAPGPRHLCHGDFHLGQLVRAAAGHWLLIDVDDLGGGDPAWDLARPAAWYACGLLAPEEWTRFLDAYRSAGGRAVPVDGSDPWPSLDVPARALTVQTAALAIAKAVAAGRPLDEVEQALVDACDRMAGVAARPPELVPDTTK